ncbi:4-oxalocrotonate tautomerase [Enterococcus sp. LJL128]
MPLIHIEIMEGRSEEKIERLIAEVTETIESVLEVPEQNVRVIVSEVPKTHWGIGGVSAKKLKR